MKSAQSATAKDMASTAKERIRNAVDRRGGRPGKKLPGLTPSRHAERTLQLVALKRTAQIATKMITTIGVRKLVVAVPLGLVAIPYVKRRIKNRVKGKTARRRRK